MRFLLLALVVVFFAPESVFAQADQVRINEVNVADNWVELYNAGNETVDVSNWWLCSFPAYATVGSRTVFGDGSPVLDPGAYLVVEWDPSRNEDGNTGTLDGEVGLYLSPSFSSSDAVADYLAYGVAQSSGRQSEAAGAGEWTLGAAVALGEAGTTLSFFDNGGAPEANWSIGTPTPNGPNEDTSTHIENVVDLPQAFVLSAAYPNPFNPVTTFTLSVAQAQEVRVQVYDVLGRPVRTLFEGVVTAGEARVVSFDADDLPSGLYLYRAEGESFSATRQVMLIK